MKTFTKFFTFIFATVLLLSYSNNSIGQNLSKENPFVQKQMQYQPMYTMAQKVFVQKLNPETVIHRRNNREIQDDFQFLIDTVYLYNVENIPKLFLYTYSAEGYRISTVVEENVNGSWEYSTYEQCTFDDSGNKLTSLWRVWQNGNFANVAKDTYTYDFNGNMLTSLRQEWNNGDWINAFRDTFIFNTDNKLLSYIDEIWDGFDWGNNAFILYTYDEFSNLIAAVGSVWIDNTWITDTQNSYTYDNNSNMIEGLTQSWQNGDWVNLFKETYTYNSANEQLTYVSEEWDSLVWVNSYNKTYTYDELGFLTQSIAQIWLDSNWINNINKEFVYAYYGGYESVITQSWDSTAWVNSSMMLNTYDDYGNTVNCEFFDWVDNDWNHTMDGVLDIYYNYSNELANYTGYLADVSYKSIIVGVDEITTGNIGNFTCSPNPATGSTVITTKMLGDAVADISLYDYEGRKVEAVFNGMLKAGVNNFTVNTQQLTPGVYVVVMKVANKTKYLKLIINR